MKTLMEFQYDMYTNEKEANNLIPLDYQTMNKDRNIGDEFMEILKNGDIRTVFQPIISLKDGSLLGYEALSRGPANSVFENPEKLFDFARVFGKLWETEFLCRIKALENISKNDFFYNIFLNVDPHIINDEKFRKGFTKEFLSNFNINPESIVFEITEKNSISDFAGFKKVIKNYKEQGYKIAIDDTGSGYSGLKLIAEIHPHYIKLDMNLIRDIDKDGIKYALIKTFYDFCLVANIKLIAEGIETENELNTLIEIGIDYGQGYLIQKPSDKFLEINQNLIKHIRTRNFKKSQLYLSKSSTVIVGDICRANMAVSPSNTGAAILDIFNNNPSIRGLPVIEDNKLVGLIMKDKFYEKLGTQYGFALYVNRPIRMIMDMRPLAVEYDTPIDTVSKLAMARPEESLYDYIIVNNNSKYFGIVSIKDLLNKITELEVNFARHLNPLSGLPGNMLIEQKLASFISNQNPFTVLYVDIDNFKAYNDFYGFEKGDRVLQYLARILQHSIEYKCIYNTFLGHIGGDDFILGVEGYDIEDLCDRIIESFEREISSFYSSEEIEKKFIVSKNRHGQEEKFGLLTLSIAGISNRNKNFADVFELSEHSSRLKKKCKEVWSSCYFIE